ncbi:MULTISPECIES: hypothetical protein [unclassified Knoellia]|uniref:hypothetical protein n=1 Tax=Knoellia altitudinis TaxID=3404795 RepID=UPI0036080D70
MRVTLAGVRSATHLVHAGSYLRHLLRRTSGEVVVDYLGSGSFLGRDNVRPEHVTAFLPEDPRLTVRSSDRAGDASGPGAGRTRQGGHHVLLSVGAPGIKPYLRLIAESRTRPEVVVVDEGIGTYGDWRTRRDAWRRQGGREPWPTVRSWAVTCAGHVLTDLRWALYEQVGGTWRVVPEVAAGFADAPVAPTSAAGEARAVYLTQPWVELGLVTEDAFRGHLGQVAAACADVGLAFAVRPHPAEAGGRYAAWPELARDLPAELDPAVVGAQVVLGTDSTALLNLAAVQRRPALRVTLPELHRLERGLGSEQRSLLAAFLPPPIDARHRGGLTRALEAARGR